MNEDDVLLQSENGPLRRSELGSVFKRLGLRAGDIVMIHSRLFTLGRFAPSMEREALTSAFIESLLGVVGSSGTLIFPTFTFAVFKTGRFSVLDTRSEMGILSEDAMSRKDSVRTHHPLYSVATIGPHGGVCQSASRETCFGKGSLFDVLHEMNGSGATKDRVRFLTIGVDPPPAALTYTHYIEEQMGVPYRYHKQFSGRVVTEGRESAYEVQGFVRNLSTCVVFDQDACWRCLEGKRGVKVERVGDSIACLLLEEAFYGAVVEAIREKSDVLCRGGYPRGDVRSVGGDEPATVL